MASAVVRKSCSLGRAVFSGERLPSLESSRQAFPLVGTASWRPLKVGSGNGLRSSVHGLLSLDRRRRSSGGFKPVGRSVVKCCSIRSENLSESLTSTQASASTHNPNTSQSHPTPAPKTSLSSSSPNPDAKPAFLRVLPNLLCLAALGALLLRPPTAWAANDAAASIARAPSARVVRASLGLTVLRIREAFRVASAGDLLAAAWTGLVAGCLHTLTGPDHLAALAPMSIGRSRLQSAWMGALWGCGHDAGQLLFGLLFLLLKDRLHMELLSQWSGVIIGVTLCGIGAIGLHEARELKASLQEPRPADAPPAAAFAGASAAGDAGHSEAVESRGNASSSSKPFGVATFITGIFHGFQPDALIMILPALALPSKLAGLSFLVTFLLGTILAMGSYTAFIGASCEVLGERVPWINEKLSQVSSTISILVGVGLISSNAFGFKIL